MEPKIEKVEDFDAALKAALGPIGEELAAVRAPSPAALVHLCVQLAQDLHHEHEVVGVQRHVHRHLAVGGHADRQAGGVALAHQHQRRVGVHRAQAQAAAALAEAAAGTARTALARACQQR
jgi:hypothetical protein